MLKRYRTSSSNLSRRKHGILHNPKTPTWGRIRRRYSEKSRIRRIETARTFLEKTRRGRKENMRIDKSNTQ
ncbi:hypothetical protein LEP1GSC013_2929 [Leptospira interrogans serovar Valbuzzi str. Duyster]|nr:hypothetical protein LEP1GSC013_2929 [Leptospira interrogans serovar Valbuzzi str. Duyster]